jgi:hypothetical protein
MNLVARARLLVPAGLVAACLVWPAAAALAQQTPSLADLARQEQERRKGVKAPAKVYSDRDVKPAPTPAVADKSALPPPVPNTPPPAEQKPKEPAKDEAYWRGRVGQVKEELRRNEAFASALQTQINSLTGDFAARDDPFQRAKLADDRQKALAELDRVKSEIDKGKKAIVDIEEEARRAGVPPGWLR